MQTTEENPGICVWGQYDDQCFKNQTHIIQSLQNKDFMPDIESKGTRIDVVEQTKLLGVIISSNLSWTANTDYIVERCNKKTWVLQ